MIRLNSISIFWYCISRLTVSFSYHLPFNQQELEKRLEEVDLGIQRGEVLSRKDRPFESTARFSSPAGRMVTLLEVENGSYRQMSSTMIMGERVDGEVFEYPTGYGDLHQMQIQKKCSFFYTL